MAGLNRAIICGRLGADVETKGSGDKIAARFSIATSEKYKDKETTTWHTIVAFGKLAELCAQFLSKGKTALVEGKIQNRSYEKDGIKKYVTEIYAQSVQFIDPAQSKDDKRGKSEDEAPW